MTKTNRKNKNPVSQKGLWLKAKLWLRSQRVRKMGSGMQAALMVLATVVLMAVVYMGERTGMWFKASILDAPQPFNGTVMPIAKVPNWSVWMDGMPDMSVRYSQIPSGMLVDLPAYDIGKMQFPDDKLVWGDRSQDLIRNTKITYPVVYMGDYKYDHEEGSGSHLAVDIKVPVGTPVHAVANGKVVKVSMVSSGFGHHVVIMHPNVPDPNGSGTTTLYSAYNHMDEISVVEGQNLLKGQQIGTSGNTGTSTTPHLHFQIDRDSAPWHPWWPFTSSDSRNAGLSFFESVNAGLGASVAKANTVNPMRFVTQHLGSFSVVSTGNSSVPVTGTPTTDSVVAQTETVASTSPTTNDQAQTETQTEERPDPVVSEGSPAGLFAYKITGDSVALVGSSIQLIVTDEKGQVKGLGEGDEVVASIDGVGSLLRKKFTKADFSGNVLRLYVRSDGAGDATVSIGKSQYEVSFVTEAKPVSSFRIEHDGAFQPGIVEKVKIVALDAEGNLAPAVNFSGFVETKAVQGEAEITPNFVRKDDFRGGVAEIKVVGGGTGKIVLRAQQGALVGQSDPLLPENGMVFTDIKPGHVNYEAIKYLKDQGIVNGYKDGTFRPGETVNRAEALKMLMTAFGIGPANSKPNFKDVDKSAWYYQALASAVGQDVVNGYKDGTFKPANTVTRAEYLKLLLKTVKMEPAGSIAKPYEDVALTDWYAPYAYMANKLNLLKPATRFNPQGGMTRAGVAETIYRMKMIKTNNWVTYSK